MAGALIGALRVSLSAETSAFEAGMKRSQRTAQTTANNIKSSFGSIRGEFGLLKAGVAGFISALSVGAIVAAGKAALDYAGSLGETAQALGVTTRELQTFRYAVSQNGGSVADADQALGKLAISLSKAQSGSKQAAAAFAAVGVSLADIQSKSREEILGKIADRMKETGGAAENAAAGVAIFGRGFLKIAPTLDQGSAGMNDLARAAEELGIVLTERQIADADKTADKIDALQTVLKARIAGAVADNADSILALADAIAQVASEAGNAIGRLRGFFDAARIASAEAEIWLSKRFDKGLLGQLGIGNKNRAANQAAAQAEIDAIKGRQAAARFGNLFQGRPKARGGTGNLSRFLESGGGGGGRRSRGGGGRDRSAEDAERKRQEALRDANQFDQEIRRAKIDVLQATRDLATDAIERYQISVDIKDAEKAAFEAQLQYEVAAGERTEVQAQQLRAEHDRLDQLERNNLIAEEQQRAFEESARLNDLQFDLERERLESESQLADTASEARDVQLRLLDLFYRQERARLETVLADEQSSEAAKEEARQRIANLNRTFANDRQGVVNNTRGPLEDFFSEVPQDAAQAQEAMERLQVQGIEGAIDSIIALTEGFDNFRDTAINAIKAVIAELIRMQLMKMAMSLFSAGAGGAGAGGGGFAALASAGIQTDPSAVLFGATGGFVSGPGTATSDSVPAMLSNGEFVMGAGAVGRFGIPFFNAINSGQLTPEMLGGSSKGGGSKGALGKAAGMGFFGVAGLLASGNKMPIFGALGSILKFRDGGLVGGGLSIPRASYSQRIGISNDNHSMGGLGGVTIPMTFHGPVTRETAQQVEYAARRGVARAAKTYG